MLDYMLPDEEQIGRIILAKLEGLASTDIFDEQIYQYAAGASHADIVKACEEAVKYSLICDEKITKELVMSYIQDRKALYKYKEA